MEGIGGRGRNVEEVLLTRKLRAAKPTSSHHSVVSSQHTIGSKTAAFRHWWSFGARMRWEGVLILQNITAFGSRSGATSSLDFVYMRVFNQHSVSSAERVKQPD